MDGQEKAPASNLPHDGNQEQVKSEGHINFSNDPTVPSRNLQSYSVLEIVLSLLRLTVADSHQTHSYKNAKLELVMEFVEEHIPTSQRSKGVFIDDIPF